MRLPMTALLPLLTACKDAAPADSDSAPDAVCGETITPGESPYSLDDTLRLNHLQAKGTHNSYHLEPDNPIDDSHRYSHAPLAEQLADQGVRQLELDLHYKDEEVFEVFHLPVVDEETVCRRLIDCLCEVREWSDAHPWHLPLMIWLEPKDDLDDATEDYRSFLGEYEELEADLRAAWPADRVLTPDDLRGAHATLPEALAAEGWPTLGALRGKVLFAMLDSGEHRAAYLEGAPALEGRVMFVDSDSHEDPFAATFKIDDAINEGEAIRAAAEAGFLITTNSDGAQASPEEAAAKAAAGLEAGAHFLSTDFPAPSEGSDYVLEIPGGTPAACNVVTAPAECSAEDIEAL